MNIGDLVLYQGRAFYLRGLDPMGVPERRAIVEDAETGEELQVPLDDVEPRRPAGCEPRVGS
jgi:hypothetical protein